MTDNVKYEVGICRSEQDCYDALDAAAITYRAVLSTLVDKCNRYDIAITPDDLECVMQQVSEALHSHIKYYADIINAEHGGNEGYGVAGSNKLIAYAVEAMKSKKSLDVVEHEAFAFPPSQLRVPTNPATYQASGGTL